MHNLYIILYEFDMKEMQDFFRAYLYFRKKIFNCCIHCLLHWLEGMASPSWHFPSSFARRQCEDQRHLNRIYREYAEFL